LDASDLFDGGQFGAQTAVHAQNALIDQRRQWQVVETLRKNLPQPNGVPSAAYFHFITLVEKSVYFVYAACLVIPTQKEKILRVPFFEIF